MAQHECTIDHLLDSLCHPTWVPGILLEPAWDCVCGYATDER